MHSVLHGDLVDECFLAERVTDGIGCFDGSSFNCDAWIDGSSFVPRSVVSISCFTECQKALSPFVVKLQFPSFFTSLFNTSVTRLYSFRHSQKDSMGGLHLNLSSRHE